MNESFLYVRQALTSQDWERVVVIPTVPTPWKAENARYGGEERTYGDSVKRQLEMYDLAGALSDVRNPSTEDFIMHKLIPHRSPPPVEL